MTDFEMIDLPLAVMDKEEWHVVQATIVDVAPHITVATFAAHPSRHYPGLYAVSNIETGLSVSDGYLNLESAADAATRRLQHKTTADFIALWAILPKWVMK